MGFDHRAWYDEMTAVGAPYRCDCGKETTVMANRWDYWVQLTPHAQPRTGLLCSTGRLQFGPILLAGVTSEPDRNQ